MTSGNKYPHQVIRSRELEQKRLREFHELVSLGKKIELYCTVEGFHTCHLIVNGARLPKSVPTSLVRSWAARGWCVMHHLEDFVPGVSKRWRIEVTDEGWMALDDLEDPQ